MAKSAPGPAAHERRDDAFVPESPPPLTSFSDADKAAACALSEVKGVGTQSLRLIARHFGSLGKALEQPGRVLAETPGLRPSAREALFAAEGLAARGQALLDKARRLGAQVWLVDEPAFPALLQAAKSPPPLLYVLGTWAERRRVAIVGSRRSDAYGLDASRRIATRLVADGFEVVSGGAEGVDRIAHEAALEAGGRSVAVLGSGLLKPYPAHHRALFERLAGQGAVVSEFAIDAGGQQQLFPRRNRTIAGLSEAVVITRGRHQSGAVSTCEAAADSARLVFAYPGDTRAPESEAPNRLLASGLAQGILDGGEVRQALEAPSPGARRRIKVQRGTSEPVVAPPVPADLSEGARRLLERLGAAPVHVDELAAAVGTNVSAALAGLLELELADLCVQRPGKYFLRR